jgi:alpha-beta hydrolase superfamily lysophospholipase
MLSETGWIDQPTVRGAPRDRHRFTRRWATPSPTASGSADEIVAAARANGVPVEYIVFPDEGHGFRKKENERHAYQAILDFLDRHLKGNE